MPLVRRLKNQPSHFKKTCKQPENRLFFNQPGFWALLLCALITVAPLLAAQKETIENNESCSIAREMAFQGVLLFDYAPEKGASALIKAYRLCVNDLAIGYNLGLAHHRLDQLEKARDVWLSIHEKHPDHLKTAANLAWVYFELGKNVEAHLTAVRAMASHPDERALVHTKVFSLFRLGRYLDAFDWLYRSRLTGLQMNDWRRQAIGYLTETLWRQFRGEGRSKKAETLAKVIELAQEYPDILEWVTTKDAMAAALIDDQTEHLYPEPLPHETWISREETRRGTERLDERLALLPNLNPWEKRDDAFALIVGVRRYHQRSGPPFADRDALNLKRILTRRGPFKEDARHLRLRLNETATWETLKQDLKWLVHEGKLNPNALLLFYYSGYGTRLQKPDGEPALWFSDEQRWPLTEIINTLRALPNEEIVVLLESCFEEPRCVSPRYAPGSQGLFTYFLMKGLMGEADGVGHHGMSDGWIDLMEGLAYVQRSLTARHHTADAAAWRHMIPKQNNVRLVKADAAR